MRENATRRKLLAGETCFGISLGLGSMRAAEVLTHSGFDFLQIDTQHGSWGPDATIAALTAISTGPATPIARVARNDYTMIGRLLDEGVLGIVVPMVHTAADAKEAADACRFPPVGTRSWGWGRAALYGDDYSEAVNDQVLVMVQIESGQAAANAEAILSTPGVDGCWIGPSDLSLSLGVHPRHRQTDERVQQAIERTLQACRDTGKIPGFAGGSVEEAKALAERGFRYLTAASDVGFLSAGARGAIERLR